jgi:hypothetical protein
MIPSGLTYSPFASYFGPDSFSVRVFDGTGYDTTVIHVNVNPTATYSVIGRDSICPGDTTTLRYIVPGGSWSTLHPSISNISGAGLLTGLTPGHDTVKYTYTNLCGTFITLFPITVGSYTVCHTGIAQPMAVVTDEILAYPNPNYGAVVLNVTSAAQEDVKVVITNLLGEKVMEFTAATNKPIEIQENYPAGVYFISAYTAQKKFAAKMVTKQ